MIHMHVDNVVVSVKELQGDIDLFKMKTTM